MNPTKNSRNSSGISKIVGENNKFCPNHTTIGRVFDEKIDGDDGA